MIGKKEKDFPHAIQYDWEMELKINGIDYFYERAYIPEKNTYSLQFYEVTNDPDNTKYILNMKYKEGDDYVNKMLNSIIPKENKKLKDCYDKIEVIFETLGE